MEAFDKNIRHASRRVSLRRGSLALLPQKSADDIPWDILERLLLPLLFCHAAATILSNLFHILHISQLTTFNIFAWLSLTTLSVLFFIHFLRVSAVGKGVLITGCESPIAWYLAKKLDDLGFTVYAGFSVPIEECEEAKVLKVESSGRLHNLYLNVNSEVSLLEAAIYIAGNLPHAAQGLWAVVHCAQWIALGELEWLPFPVLRKSMDINLLGVTHLTQLMLPLVRRSQGRIIFLTSALHKISEPSRSIQCATQAALESLAACLRQEMRLRKVNVAVVSSGEFSCGSDWLNEVGLREQSKAMWSNLSDEQKRTYGEDYFEAAMSSIEKYSKVTTDLRPTLRVLIEAVRRTFPMARYTPVTPKEKLRIFIAEHLPTSIYATLYDNSK